MLLLISMLIWFSARNWHNTYSPDCRVHMQRAQLNIIAKMMVQYVWVRLSVRTYGKTCVGCNYGTLNYFKL